MMLVHLAPCPSCARHVRVAERSCPFCSAALTARAPKRIPDVSRLSRAAQVALGAALAVGCASDPGPGPASPEPAPTVVPAYGAPAPAPPPEEEGGEGGGSAVEPAPEPEPGPPPESGPNDPGAVRPLYGVPATPE